jgi:hypothetical protein
MSAGEMGCQFPRKEFGVGPGYDDAFGSPQPVNKQFPSRDILDFIKNQVNWS